MSGERLYDVETTERLHCTHRVYAESAEEAERIAVANAWSEGEPREWEVGPIISVVSVEEVQR